MAACTAEPNTCCCRTGEKNTRCVFVDLFIYMEGDIAVIAQGHLWVAVAIMAGGEGQETGQAWPLIGPVKR